VRICGYYTSYSVHVIQDSLAQRLASARKVSSTGWICPAATVAE
jgi:hypothetical protein